MKTCSLFTLGRCECSQTVREAYPGDGTMKRHLCSNTAPQLTSVLIPQGDPFYHLFPTEMPTADCHCARDTESFGGTVTEGAQGNQILTGCNRASLYC